MRSEKTLFTVESHTMGEPLRLIVGGMPPIKGETMADKKDYLEEHYAYLREAMIQEPRGHKDMFGAVLVPPCIPEADLGVIFMHGQGYHNMCGHGTIATSTIAVETGLVEVKEPETLIKLNPPAGLVTVHVHVKDGKAESVSFENVPSFLYKEDVELDVEGFGKVKADITFGGSFFALVDYRELGIEIEPENCDALIEAGMAVVRAANEQLEIQHPELPINTVDLCEIYGPAKSDDADMQNIAVFDNQIDRSPCGTGTSAKVATLYAKGKLGLNEEFVYESVIKTKFIGKAIKETKVGEFDAIIPEITGAAYITGYSQWMIDPEDPVKHGFVIG